MVEEIVSDNGCGIGEEYLASLSEPFVSSKPNGSGLGLPIARRIVGEHGGTLDIESAAGEGTIVRVRLPRLNESSGAIERNVLSSRERKHSEPARNA
jgi:signal transduction histidine kinase